MSDDAVVEQVGSVRERSRKAAKSSRRKLYKLHTWVGFHLAAVMVLVLVTGTVATISNEIDWLIQDDMRVVPDDDRVSWQDMVNAAQAYLPDHRLSILSDMGGDHFAFRARMIDETGHHVFVHINQWTGQVTGTTHPLTVQRFFRDLHRYLFMPSIIGLPIVTSMAFVLAVSLYTGLRTSRNWKTLMTRVRTNRGLRIALGDLHKAAGLWSIWFFVVMIVTGVWYLAEFGTQVAGGSFEPERPRLSADRIAQFGDVIPDASTDEVVDATASVFPELRITQIQFPSRPADPITVLGENGNPILRQRANRVFFDPVSLEPLKVQRSGDIGWLAWLNEIADPLHFGYFGGLPTKLVWFLFGLAMTGLSVTGVWLTWKRLRSLTPSAAQVATFPVLILTMIGGTFWYERFQIPSEPTNVTRIAAKKTDIGEMRIRRIEDAEGNPTGQIQLQLFTSERPNLSKASVYIWCDEDGLQDSIEMPLGSVGPLTQVTAVFTPESVECANRIEAQLKLGSGRLITLDASQAS